MIKKILILFIFIPTIVNAEILEKVEINGNKRISLETIKVYGEIEIGKDYSNYELDKVLKNLYSTNFFEDVFFEFKDSKLTINVREYPIINSIIISGEESKNFKELIVERIQLKEKSSYISSRLKSDIELIKKIYASLGYNFTQVDFNVENFSENRVNLEYKITKGDKTYIKQINFIGDKKIRDSKLRDIIVSEEKKFWKFLSKNTYFNQSNIELDKRLLLNYYRSIGFYDAQIISNNSEIINNSYINIDYTINAGKRFKINKISTNLDKVINEEYFFPLEKVFKDYVGTYYSPFKIKKILEEVDNLIVINDLQFIEHSVSEILDSENIEIKINIFEGKKDIVEKIKIYGNTVTDEAVIRSELLIDEGDPFNNLKFDKSIAKLKSRNIFGKVETKILDSTKKNQKILEIKVEEKPTGEISAGAGIGTSGGSFAFKVSENNWLGKGIKLSTNLDLSSESASGELSVIDPNYNFSGNEVSYYIANTSNDKPDSGYKNNIFSAGTGIKFEQYRDIYVGPALTFSYDDLKVEDSASAALQKQRGSFTDFTFDYSITKDKRDRVYGATDGYILGFNQSIPLYADSPSIRNTISFNKYHSFNPDMIGAIKLYGSAINGINNKDVRLSKRVFLNSYRLRGFESGKVGPKDGADYIGGNYAAVSNFELNLPNLLPESSKIDIGVFFDIGNIWHVDYSDIADNSNKIRSTVGLNTNWMSPVGPMSFVFSNNISKADTDVTESFNFRLGTTF